MDSPATVLSRRSVPTAAGAVVTGPAEPRLARTTLSPMGETAMIDENGPHYFVVLHSPGPNWVAGKAYNDQPDFRKHAAYISTLHDQGKIVLSGPFMRKPGGLAGVLADEGMAVLRTSDLAEAIELALDDPTVRSGMIEAKVKTMWVPFHG